MSFLGLGGNSAAPSGPVNQQAMQMALVELDLISDVFSKVVNSCHAKCINQRYAEPDLNKGESVCIDRCVAKFFEVNKKVGDRLQQAGAAAQAAGGVGSFGM